MSIEVCVCAHGALWGVREASARADLFGPFQRLSIVCGDWAVIAEELPFPDRTTRWDVRAEHKSGSRVPLGPSLHRQPEQEMQRLVKVIDWPSPTVRK